MPSDVVVLGSGAEHAEISGRGVARAPQPVRGRGVAAQTWGRGVTRLMLVSAHVTPQLRAQVAQGMRPCPEFLKLEALHGVRLLDWTAAGVGRGSARTPTTVLRHLRAALSPLSRAEAVLSDGEHLGIPLAIGLRVLGLRTPHLMIAHHVTTAKKAPCFRVLHADRRIDRLLVHSERQLRLARRRLGLPPGRVALVPYGVDTDFWRPMDGDDEPLIVAPGREHRDHRVLAAACGSLPLRVFVADASLHNPGARHAPAAGWPPNCEHGSADPFGLRHLYSRSRVVVVPLIPTDFPAGVTSVLEAMAMARPVIVSGTRGLAGIVQDGSTGVVVPPGDAGALADAIRRLAADPRERRRLGSNAREDVVARFGVGLYAERLAEHLSDLSRPGGFLDGRGGEPNGSPTGDAASRSSSTGWAASSSRGNPEPVGPTIPSRASPSLGSGAVMQAGL